ncbi:hypothetical protein CsatB_017680 [Cannabis sativa]|uniref:protein PHYTOCHROME KINASE SUBSTRATE 3 n=1 Tax=Cannabis sativa TaxID=3483 RepID=UPI0029CA7748|nr:protein PHYTOCHROME KINASE SUBSTRATE 3 [Cannabis sativa]
MEVRADQYSNDDNHNFRDASFSYLREENLNQKSMKNKNSSDHHQEEGEICVFGAERYFNTALEDTKTSNRINKNNNHLNTINRRSSSITMQNDMDHNTQYGGGERSLAPGTPSAYSEASTWTSRSTAFLLRNSSRHQHNSNSEKKKKKIRTNGYRKSIFATFGCSGSCSDEKSVYVDRQHHDHHELNKNMRELVLTAQSDHHDHDHDHENSTARAPATATAVVERSSKRSEDQFAFPILSNKENNSNNNVINNIDQPEDPNRLSLEVFGSKTTTSKGGDRDDIDDVATNLERKLSVLTWDAIPVKPGNHHHHHHHHQHNKHISSVYKIEDSSYNLDSDASSDLFEIENITAATRSPELLQPPAQATSSVLVLKPASRQVLLGKNDNMSLHMTPNYNSDQYYSSYEPSEASIDWSVVTASAAAADQMMSSAVFGYDEKKLTASSSMNTSRATAGRGGVKYYKAARRSGSGGGGGFKGGRSRQNNGILGCKSHKAVRVAETVHTNDSRSN